MKLISFFLTVILLLGACSKQQQENSSIKTYPRQFSSAGHEAHIFELISEAGSNSQVLVNFANQNCGSGAASAIGVNLDLKLEWRNHNTLVIYKQREIDLTLNPSGSRLKCFNQYVNIEVVDA